MQDYKETALNIDLDMVYVEGGEFQMGLSPTDKDSMGWDSPIRTIRLDSYYLGKYPITQAQWEKVMGTNLKDQWEKWMEKHAGRKILYPITLKRKSPLKKAEKRLHNRKQDFHITSYQPFNHYDMIGKNYPMEYVNWEEAQEFCEKLSKASGKHYALPTEAQWEYAARGGIHKENTKYSGSNNLLEIAWEEGACTHPVGSKKANALDIYDMGNLWEWCSDFWKDNYNMKDLVNPTGPKRSKRINRRRGKHHVVRGNRMSVSQRLSFHSTLRLGMGFRIACIP